MSARCVLIVHGVPVMARMLVEALAEAGWSAQVATRLGEALAALERRSFCAVLSEVEIPDGDGFELLTRVRALPAPKPAVILTSLQRSSALARRADEAGALGYLGKPFELEALVELLESARSPAARA